MARTITLGLTGLPKAYNISLSVGPAMPNLREDVLLAQTLMKMANFVRLLPGRGPIENSRDIKVDGYFGPQTQRLILAFEEHVLSSRRLLVADGCLDPSSQDGYTGTGVLFKIIHLNRFAKDAVRFEHEYSYLPTDPNTHPVLRAALGRNSRRAT